MSQLDIRRKRKKQVQRLRVGACLACSRAVWLEWNEGRGKVVGDIERVHVLYKHRLLLSLSVRSASKRGFTEQGLT